MFLKDSAMESAIYSWNKEGCKFKEYSYKPLTIITKRSILDVAAALDPPLLSAVHL